MRTRIRHHAYYIHDLGAANVDHVREVTAEEAAALLRQHGGPDIEEAPGDLDRLDDSFENKAWVCLYREGDRVICLYNHDGNFRVKSVTAASVAAYCTTTHRPRIAAWCEAHGVTE